MDYPYEIITYGGGEALTLLFNGIAAAIGDNNYTTLIRLSGLIGLCWILIESTFRQNLALNAKWFMSFVVMYNALLVPKVTVHIIDRLQQSQLTTIAHVPWGLALFASLASEIGDTLTRLAEKNFALPDDLQYSKTGNLMAAQLIKSARQFTITDAGFAHNIQGYMRQCVFYDVMLGKYSLQDLLTTGSLWLLMTQQASPARSFPYRTQQGENIITCQQGAALLTHDWKGELPQAISHFGKRLFSQSPDAKAALIKYLPISYGYLTHLSEQAENLMQQTMLANAVQQGLIGQAAEVNASAALQAYAIQRANDNQRGLYQVTGELAVRWLPLMKNVFEALLYGAFLFLFPLMLLPIGAQVFKSYILALFWLQSWTPLYAILNLIMTVDAKSHSLAAVAQTHGSAVSLATLPGLIQVNADTAALAGYIAMSIPFIAYGIVKGGVHTLSHVAGSLTSSSQGIANSASNEASTGNISLGNTSFSTHSANNLSANHINDNASLESGLYSTQTQSGAMLHYTSSGSVVIDNRNTTLSNTGTKVNLADALRASAGQHYEQAITQAHQQMQAYSQSSSAVLRDLYDLAASQGNLQASDKSSSVSLSGGVQQSIQQTKELVDRFAREQGLTTSQAVQILGEANAHAGIGVGGEGGPVKAGVGIGGSIQGISSAQHQNAFRAAQDYAKANRFAETTDVALKGIQDTHYKTGSDKTQRLVDTIQSANEQADSYRHDVNNSLQQAEGYRHVVSQVTEQALAINSDLSQAFVNSLQQQVGVNNAEYLLNHDPLTARSYANQFAEQYVAGEVRQWVQGQGLGSSNEVAAHYQNQAVPGGGGQAIQQQQQNQRAQVGQQAQVQGLGVQQTVDATPLTRSAQLIQGSTNQVVNEEADIAGKGHSLQEQANLNTQNNHDLTSRAIHGAVEAAASIVKSD